MTVRNQPSPCTNCALNRRGFLQAGCAAAAVGLLAAPQRLWSAETQDKAKIRIIYSLHDVVQPQPDWPNTGFDFAPVMERIPAELAKRCPGFEFVTSMAKGEEEAKAILESDKAANIDGYLVYQLNCWNRVVQTMVESGKPVLYADFQYGGSGGFLVYTAEFLRKNTPNFAFVASSKLEDLAEAVQCFSLIKKGGSPADFSAAVTQKRLSRTPAPGDRSGLADPLKTVSPDECIQQMKQSRILAVRDQNAESAEPLLGIPLEYITFAEVNKAWENADQEESREIAERWKKNASQVLGVSDDTLLTSAAMYLGMKEVLKQHNANAITINCLGGFYGGHIHAYPCLGFHELNNEGLIGGCECDVKSAATMVMITALTQGRPGYISDPVIDTSRRQIIYAHCVASNKVFGPQGRTNPFSIMTHSEDRQGASVRSLLPLGYMTTTLEIEPLRKEILFHQGKAVANDPDDRACRTKLAVEPVGDLEKLFTQWDQWGWHRVTAYGDLKEPVYALAEQMGWKVVEEA
ncbi:MAG: twin-arginine translocation signal domain-containing protein [bacterium]